VPVQLPRKVLVLVLVLVLPVLVLPVLPVLLVLGQDRPLAQAGGYL